jgi:hypothetical protein
VGKNMAALHTWWSGKASGPRWPLDETIVVAMCAGVALAFVIASVNKVTRLGLLSRMAERVTFVLIPPLLLIFLVLGTIFLGVATPTEGGAMGAMGAIIMAMARGRLSLSLLQAGADHHHQAVVLCGVHPGGLHHVQPDLPGRGRPAVGGAPADRPARWPAGLPDRGEHHDVLPGVLPGLL